MSSSVLSSPSVARVRDALLQAGLVAEIVELPGAARTARTAAEFLGCEISQIANSLVFRAETTDSAVLVMCSGARRVDTARLAQVVAEPVSKADADFVRRHTGFAIGGVAPLGHSGDVTKFVERSLSGHARLWAAAGHPHTVFSLTFSDLLKVTAGRTIDVAAA